MIEVAQVRGGGGYPLSQINQILFEIDISLLLRTSTLPPPASVLHHPYAARRMGCQTEGVQNCQIQKKIEKVGGLIGGCPKT
jgi:hypothetical protein